MTYVGESTPSPSGRRILSTSLDEMRAGGNEYLNSLRSSHYYLNEKYNWVSEKHALKGNVIEVVFLPRQ